jgi:prepilin-type N-terminal cleavage/methylation domain-containing protein
MSHKKSGFTLIEMSFVLVIIALIIGAIFVGKSVLHSAELQSVVTDYTRYQNAIKIFRDKYKYYPGDFPTATTVWGTYLDCTFDDVNYTPTTNTCNGNGNGKIINAPADDFISVLSNFAESHLVFKHLMNAGLIEGGTIMGMTYDTGSFGRATNRRVGGIYSIYSAPPAAASANYFASKNGVLITLGGAVTRATAATAPIFTPTDALSIDQKIDDALPGTGILITPIINVNGGQVARLCPTTDDALTATYDTSRSDRVCFQYYLTGFF